MVANKEEKRHMTADELADIREQLLERKKVLWNEVVRDLEEDAQETHREVLEVVREAGEMGLEEIRETNAIRVIRVKVEELEKIEQALRRIEDGGYGICQDCEEWIPPARLAVMPYALRCVACQENTKRSKR